MPVPGATEGGILKRSIGFVAVCAAVLLAGSAVQAEDGFYLGLGGGAGSGQSDGGDSAGTLGNVGLTFGYRQDMDGFFWGGEIDSDLSFYDNLENSGDPCSVIAHGPYYCTHDVTVRFRGVLGTELTDGVELFGTFGVGLMEGQGAIDPNATDSATTAGFTGSLGAQMDLGPGTIRGEIIYDNFSHNLESAAIYSPTWSETSAKVTYLIGF